MAEKSWHFDQMPTITTTITTTTIMTITTATTTTTTTTMATGGSEWCAAGRPRSFASLYVCVCFGARFSSPGAKLATG